MKQDVDLNVLRKIVGGVNILQKHRGLIGSWQQPSLYVWLGHERSLLGFPIVSIVFYLPYITSKSSNRGETEILHSI